MNLSPVRLVRVGVVWVARPRALAVEIHKVHLDKRVDYLMQ